VHRPDGVVGETEMLLEGVEALDEPGVDHGASHVESASESDARRVRAASNQQFKGSKVPSLADSTSNGTFPFRVGFFFFFGLASAVPNISDASIVANGFPGGPSASASMPQFRCTIASNIGGSGGPGCGESPA
jgi:hypothetical protein